jgi:hypothetical protein
MTEPTELEIARMTFVMECHKEIGWLVRDDVYGIDVEAQLYLLLKSWEKKLLELKND